MLALPSRTLNPRCRKALAIDLVPVFPYPTQMIFVSKAQNVTCFTAVMSICSRCFCFNRRTDISDKIHLATCVSRYYITPGSCHGRLRDRLVSLHCNHSCFMSNCLYCAMTSYLTNMYGLLTKLVFCKKRTRPISSHLDRKSLVNKGFIIWLSRKFFLRDTSGSPERAR